MSQNKNPNVSDTEQEAGNDATNITGSHNRIGTNGRKTLDPTIKAIAAGVILLSALAFITVTMVAFVAAIQIIMSH